MKPEINIFIHRRDYRINDNSSLNLLIDKYPNIPIMHIFIFNPKQIDFDKNQYFNENCVEFMIQSLKSLRDELKDAFYFFYGSDSDVLKKLISIYRVNCIAWNLDYTPFARARDMNLSKWCEQIKIESLSYEDYTLFKLGHILTGSKKPYEIYTPFANKCIANIEDISKPITKTALIFNTKPPNTIKNIDKFYNTSNPNLKVKGGRHNALEILSQIRKGYYKNYEYARDFPNLDKTTKLAAYIKFGCVSIREVFYAFKDTYGNKHGLVRELLFREFYSQATWHYPDVLNGKPFKSIDLKWNYKKEWYDNILGAKTGYPIIDAAIRELKTTGWMNNRLRMVVASFITKDLMMDWHIFEKDLFARYLVDYDPSVNCHSWQGMASVGIGAGPYWRIINPWRQTERFDKNCEYIKLYIPELANIKPIIIRNWRIQLVNLVHNYPSPMVDHEEQVKLYLEYYKSHSKT